MDQQNLQKMNKSVWQLPHFKTQIIFVSLLLLGTAVLSYFTSQKCIKECVAQSSYPLACMDNGDFYCCGGNSNKDLPKNCQGCTFQNNHCIELMVGAVICFVLAFLLISALLFRCRSLRKNIERSKWSVVSQPLNYYESQQPRLK